MADNEVNLVWKMTAQGAESVQRSVDGIANRVGDASRAAARAPDMSAWHRGLRSLNSGLDAMLGRITRAGAMFAGLGGAVGLGAVAKDVMSADRALTAIAVQLDLSGDAADRLSRRFTDLAGVVGRPAAELMGLADTMNDLAVGWDRAESIVGDLARWSIAIGEGGNIQSVAEAFAGLEQMTGGTLDPKKQLALLNEMLAGAGMPEADFFQMSTRLFGVAGEQGGLQGTEGAAELGGLISVLGESFRGQPRKIVSAMDMLLQAFTEAATNREFAAALRGMGVDMTNVATMFRGLSDVMAQNPGALEGVAGVPSELSRILLGTRNAATDMEETVQAIRNASVADLDRVLARGDQGAAQTIARATEGLKAAFIPFVEAVINGLAGRAEDIKALGEFLGRLGSFAIQHGGAILLTLGAFKAASLAQSLSMFVTSLRAGTAASAAQTAANTSEAAASGAAAAADNAEAAASARAAGAAGAGAAGAAGKGTWGARAALLAAGGALGWEAGQWIDQETGASSTVANDLAQLMTGEDRASMLAQAGIAARQSTGIGGTDFGAAAGTFERGASYAAAIKGMGMADQVGPLLRLLQDMRSGAVSPEFAAGAAQVLNIKVSVAASPDGVSTDATVDTDRRSGATPTVRTDGGWDAWGAA